MKLQRKKEIFVLFWKNKKSLRFFSSYENLKQNVLYYSKTSSDYFTKEKFPEYVLNDLFNKFTNYKESECKWPKNNFSTNPNYESNFDIEYIPDYVIVEGNPDKKIKY